MPTMPQPGAHPQRDVSPAEVLDAVSAVLIVVIDGHGRIAYANAASRPILGYEPEELIGRSGDELIPSGLVADARKLFLSARAGAPRLSQRLLARRADLRHTHLHVDISPMIAEEGGVAGVVVAARVIDEPDRRPVAPSRRARPKASAAGLIERLPAVVYVAEPGEAGRWRYVSPHIERMLGYTPAEWRSRPSLWAERIHPDDRARVLKEESQDIAGENALNTEYRMVTRAGEILWVHDEAIMRVDANGVPYYDGLLTDITERKRFETQLQYFADHDWLTGLANRRRFVTDLDGELKGRRRHDEPGSVLMLDLDGLKEVNDNLGHHVGDELLRATADAMTSRLRESDTVARLGGDEFAVLLRGTDEDHALVVATEVVRAIEAEAERLLPQLGGCSASAGVAEIRGRFRTPEQVLDAADRAMYEAKRMGGGRAETHPPRPPT